MILKKNKKTKNPTKLGPYDVEILIFIVDDDCVFCARSCSVCLFLFLTHKPKPNLFSFSLSLSLSPP